MKTLVEYRLTPQVTALEYSELRDLQQNPDKAGYYNDLVKQRTSMGKDFETKAVKKKARR